MKVCQGVSGRLEGLPGTAASCCASLTAWPHGCRSKGGWLGCALVLLAALLSPGPAFSQSYSLDAVSREISLFMDNPPGPGVEAIAREVSLFMDNPPGPLVEVISREVSIFAASTYNLDTISREVSIMNYGYNHLNLAVGSTVVLVGTTGSVSVALSTLATVTNVQVAVDFPQNLLTNWSVQPLPPFTGTASVSNGNRLYLTFSPTNGQNIDNTQLLGQISFASATNQPSAFLPLPVAGATAPMLDGSTYTPYLTAVNGEVVVLNKRSLLRQTPGTNNQESLTLYGLSGTNYTIESATNLIPPINWQPAYVLTPSNFIAVTPALATTNPAMFFRAKQ
ncbi:MAG: hypothetical protein JWR26_2856 [Pedosphaera sp.]|nr:hypothetical protein [Pedosphaera sp.]